MSTKHTISDIFSGNNGGRRGAVRAWLLIGVCALLGAFLVGCPNGGTAGPSVSITTSPTSLTENSLNGATLTLTLKNATYTDPLPADAVTLTTTPSIAGLSVGSVARRSATEAVVMLAKDSVDFTVDTELTVTVLAAAHSGNGNLTAPAVSIAAVATPALGVSLSTPAANTITEGDGTMTTDSTTLTVDLDSAAPSALNVLVDITQMAPAATPANVTYGLDYGVTIDSVSAATGFMFDSATTPGTLMTRQVTVPFAATDTSRTLTITAAEDVDGLSEVLSIRLVADNSYRITSENTNTAAAARTLTMTDNEPAVILDELNSVVDAITEGGSPVIAVIISAPNAGGVEVNVAVSGASPGDANSARGGSGDDFAGLTSATLSNSIPIRTNPGIDLQYFTLDDGVTEGDETWTVTILPGDGYQVPQSPNPVSRSIIIQDAS